MSLLYGVSQVMHRIKVKLYPNYLPKGEGTFLARTDSEATLFIEQVCAAMRARGGYKGDFDDLVIENTPTKIVGIAPSTQHQRNRIEVRTRYAGSGINLKNIRVITGPFILEEA